MPKKSIRKLKFINFNQINAETKENPRNGVSLLKKTEVDDTMII